MLSKEYWDRLTKTLENFCAPGDELVCASIVKMTEQSCEMCGYSPITWNYTLTNPRTKAKLTVGSKCIVNYKQALEKMKRKAQPIIFEPRYTKRAALINKVFPGTVVVRQVKSLEQWITKADEEREYRREMGFDLAEDDYQGQEEEEREMLMDMGLDPNDPDFADLRPH